MAAAQDPMIELARMVDAPARKFRKTGEAAGEAMQQAYAKLAKARFALEGTNVYPDATFTLRLAFGVVEGYVQGEERIPPWTTLGGAYQHAEAHGGRPPYNLPKRWLDRKDRLDLRTPLNFLSTADIIGGNSGSPVVNRAASWSGSSSTATFLRWSGITFMTIRRVAPSPWTAGPSKRPFAASTAPLRWPRNWENKGASRGVYPRGWSALPETVAIRRDKPGGSLPTAGVLWRPDSRGCPRRLFSL